MLLYLEVKFMIIFRSPSLINLFNINIQSSQLIIQYLLSGKLKRLIQLEESLSKRSYEIQSFLDCI